MNKINFTYKIKKEIYINIINDKNLKYAVAGILYNDFLLNEEYDSNYLSRNFDVLKILKKYFQNSEIIKQNQKYEIIFKLNNDILEIIKNINERKIINMNNINLFFSGLFLSCGSISEPSKSYHFEIRIQEEKYDSVKWIFNKLNINFSEIKHNNKIVFYVKKNDVISDILKILKANECMFYLEECKISKDFNISIQRINNLDVSNINKQTKVGQEIISIINFLTNTSVFNQLDPLILDYCEIRKKYPEYSIKQIVEVLNNKNERKVTKSWVNHINIKLRTIFNKYK